jgi:hypothetical protein
MSWGIRSVFIGRNLVIPHHFGYKNGNHFIDGRQVELMDYYKFIINNNIRFNMECYK